MGGSVSFCEHNLVYADVMHYMTKMGLPDESCLTCALANMCYSCRFCYGLSSCSCRYTATDHTLYNESLKHCPPEAICRNCMPLPDKSGKEVHSPSLPPATDRCEEKHCHLN